MAEEIEHGDDEDLLPTLSLAANWMMLCFNMAQSHYPDDAPELIEEHIEATIKGLLQDWILEIQQHERRPYLKGPDLMPLMTKVNERCQRWLEGDFR